MKKNVGRKKQHAVAWALELVESGTGSASADAEAFNWIQSAGPFGGAGLNILGSFGMLC